MTTFDPTTLKHLYENECHNLLSTRWKEWRSRYLAYVQRVQSARQAEWVTSDFQRFLWDDDGVSGVGLGATVTVERAYEDREIAEALLSLRDLKLESDVALRAKQLSDGFAQIIGLVSPKYNDRKPSARLIRLFCGLFPGDVLVLLDSHKTNVVRRGLGMKKGGLEAIAQHVLLRQKFHEALGTPKSVEQQVEQSMFSWLLFDRLEREVAAEEGEAAGEPSAATAEAKPQAGAGPSLRMLPVTEQRKGIYSIANGLGTVMQLLRFTENGATREELVSEILNLFPKLKRSSAEMYVSLLRTPLGVIELRDQALRPTARGQQLLDGEDAADVLAPVLIGRVFGFAQILAVLKGNAGLSKAKIYEHLQKAYPRWTSDYMAAAVLGWAKAIGLVESAVEGKTPVERLTEVGSYWASGLPEDLEIRWQHRDSEYELEQAGTSEHVESTDEAHGSKLRHPPLTALAKRFASEPELRGLVYPEQFLAKFDAALRALPSKRFALLAGLSGTGKTSLARAYARACCDELKVPFTRHYREVSVRPDWTDPSGLLGYFNPLAKPPRYEETAALELVLAAKRDPEHPYFLCLDEMNLARVEHYFAPFLTAMEGRGTLQIHHEHDEIDQVPSRIPWPRNLFIIGTVNMDETTHPFSDKVLDRAFSFELWDVDIRQWSERIEAGDAKELTQTVVETLRRLYDALYPARRHFGYRTCDEVLAFCRTAQLPVESALDAAVLAKVLPKLRGDDAGELPEALRAVRVVCQEKGLVECKKRIEQMLKSIEQQGMAKFWA